MYIAAFIIFIIIILLAFAMKPFKLNTEPQSNPVQDYEQACALVEAAQAEDAEATFLNPVCGTKLLTHGEKTEKVILFFHGFTSCPAQFIQLGEEFFNQGYNVYIPRLPRHGTKDREGNTLKGLTAEMLADFATQAVDIAEGLGSRVIVAGLSGGGSMAIWIAQVRSDVELAVPIAPFLGVGFIPSILNRPLTNLLLMLPNFFQWWDPVNKANRPDSTPYAYLRYPVHSLLENMRLGFSAEAAAKKVRPAAGRIITVSNANDISVSNKVIAEFEKLWSRYGEEDFRSYQFPKELELPHDLISPERPDANTQLVYSKLLEIIH